MAQRPSPSSGRDPDYQSFLDEQEKARRLVAKIDINEDFAQQWEQFPQIYTELSGRELEHGRQRFAITYRKIIGVMPDQRGSLRSELQEIMRTGNGTVDAAMAAARVSTARVIGDASSSDPSA